MIDDLMWGYSGGGMSTGGGSPTPMPKSDSVSTDDIRQAVERIDKLTLVCMAMWSLVQEETKLTEADLIERVKQIDLMDGVEDGKVTKQVAKCGNCNRVMNQRHQHCLYCGHERLILSAFDPIT